MPGLAPVRLLPAVRIFLDNFTAPPSGAEITDETRFIQILVGEARRCVQEIGVLLAQSLSSDAMIVRLCSAASFFGAVIAHGGRGEHVTAARSMGVALSYLESGMALAARVEVIMEAAK